MLYGMSTQKSRERVLIPGIFVPGREPEIIPPFSLPDS